jgi:hypothetical protein
VAQGFILEVSITRVGSELDTDILAGDTVLPVIDITQFSDETGLDVDQVEVADAVLSVSDYDPDLSTLTVLLGPDTDLDAGTAVFPLPPVLEKWAMVEVNGQDEPISALVGGDLYDRIPDGVRDPEDQEPVVVEMQNGDWTVVNLVGEEPTTDGSFLDPETVPTSADVQTAIDEMREDITTNAGQLTNILGDPDLGTEGRLQNVEETATSARNLANTADGRVSMCDYRPSAEDVTYIATGSDGLPILDADGLPVLLQRNEGSIWFQRTRTRVNLCANPSFETNLTGWATSQLTVSRDTHAAAPAGGYVATLTNNTTAGLHTFTWDNGGGAARQAVVEGLKYTWSYFAEAVSGDNTGVYAEVEFFTAAGASLGTFAGTPVDLVVNDWTELGGSRRPTVTAEAPATAAFAVGRAVHPNISAVWRVDGFLLEAGDILGSYFDGSLYDSGWGEDRLGTAHGSQSFMDGGKILTIWELDDGGWVQKWLMGDTLVDLNASSITQGEMDGIHLVDGSVPQDKISASPCTTTELIPIGSIVNLYSLNGVIRCRLAKAAPGYEAHGFVLEEVPSGGLAYVYSHGYNPFAVPTNMKPGPRFLATTPGQSTPVAPKAAGQIVQRVGVAVNTVVMNFTPGDPITIL